MKKLLAILTATILLCGLTAVFTAFPVLAEDSAVPVPGGEDFEAQLNAYFSSEGKYNDVDIKEWAPNDATWGADGAYDNAESLYGIKAAIKSGRLRIFVRPAGTAALGMGCTTEWVLDGAHLNLYQLKTIAEGGNMFIALGATPGSVFDKASMIKFDAVAGTATAYPGAGGDVLISDSAVIKAMPTTSTNVAFHVDSEGLVSFTLTNTAGSVTSEKLVNYGSEWTDHTKAYVTIGVHAVEGGKYTFDLRSYHSGDEKCCDEVVADLKAEAAPVEALIAAIGEPITLESLSAIEEAEAAYAALSEWAQGVVSNYDVLKAARTAYNKVVADPLKTEYELHNVMAEDDIEQHYGSMDKGFEEGKGVILDCWDKSLHSNGTRFGTKNAFGVDGLKIVLRGLENLKTEASIGLVETASTWFDLPQGMLNVRLGKVSEAYPYGRVFLQEFIGGGKSRSIGEVAFDTDVLSDGEALIEYYVSEDGKSISLYVEGYFIDTFSAADTFHLTDLTKVYPHFGLFNEEAQSYAVYSITDKATYENLKAVAPVEEMIASLGEITLESKAAIDAAKAAYDALTEEQQALVSNVKVLAAAMDTYDELLANAPATDEPVTDEPATDAPVTEVPVTDNPKTGESAAVLPVLLLCVAAGSIVLTKKRR